MDLWIDQLIHEYTDGKKQLVAHKAKLDQANEKDCQDITQLNSMIQDMEYSLEWLKKGRRPGNVRGADKRSIYQRRVLVDVDLLPSLDIAPKPRELTETERELLQEILLILSHRERHCYLLHFAQGWSMQMISEELDIAKPSVQKYIERAKQKIHKKLACHTSVV